MLIDSTQSEHEFCTDICIVGSGIGAGTLALKLAEKGIGFTVIEAGDKDHKSDVVQKEHVGHEFGWRVTTSTQLGGTSNLWHGVLSPLDEIDFQRREWVPYSGWPITLKDLEPFYREAATLLGVEDYDYFNLDTLEQEFPGELAKLNYNRNYISNKIFQQPIPAKNFKQDIIKLTRTSKKNHCIYNAVALELEINKDNDKAIRLKYGDKTGGFKFISAKRFIICAGALETPRILLNSRCGNGIAPGNAGDNVGRFLLDHPMGNLCQIGFNTPKKSPIYSDVKFRSNQKVKSGLELNIDLQQKLGLPNHNFFVRPSFVRGINDESEKIKLSLLTLKDGDINVKDLFKVFTNLNVVKQILTYKLSLDVTYKYSDLFFVTEQIPNPNSRVKLSQKTDRFGYPISQIDWQVLPEDINSMFIWFKLLKEHVFDEKHYTFTHSYEDFNWEEIYTSAVHHVGTTRMANSDKEGVVDKNLKVFGIKNLYVSDGSVFSTAGNVNNGLTIAALSCRLADHIRKKVE